MTPPVPPLPAWSLPPNITGRCMIVVMLDLAWWVSGAPGVLFGRVNFDPADILAVWFCWSLGSGLLRNPLAPFRQPPLAVMACVAVLAAWSWAPPAAVLCSVVAASLLEEVVFRLCWPVALAVASARVSGRRVNAGEPASWSPHVRVLALSGATVSFALRPGHLDQVEGAAGALPFLAAGVLFVLLSLRCGSLGVSMAAHVTLNLVSFAHLEGSWPRPMHTAGVLVAGVAALWSCAPVRAHPSGDVSDQEPLQRGARTHHLDPQR